MEEYPMTFDEFIKNFSTEEQCRDYLFKLRWPDGFVCPACGVTKYWPVNGKLYECVECGRQTSVISGTIFQDTRSPLTKWFTAIWWITTQKNGASAKGLQQVLGLSSYETAWTWLHKIRKAMVRGDRTKLSGTVEVDETYIGGEEHSGSTGRGTGNKVIVAVAAEVNCEGRLGRVRLRAIPDASKSSLIPFVTDNVETGSEVITDGWPSYSSLGEDGYRHTIHVQKDKLGEEKLLPHVHLVISLLKRWLLGTHQGAASDKHMQAYLEEYTFRFNRRKAAQRELLFYRLLEGAVVISPHTYSDIVKAEKS
jgi:transposase-like protein/Zn ribbon nucleic-acid-binding protein